MNSRLALFSMISLLAGPAMAIDTSEPIPVGLTDVELYFSSNGMGNEASERNLNQTLVLGAGIAGGFSIFGSYSLGGDGELKNGTHGYSAKLSHRPVDTEHFDLDLWFNTIQNGQLVLSPGFEINLDHSDALKTFGFFTQVNFQFFNQTFVHTNQDGLVQDGKDEVTLDIALTPGVYYSINSKQQVLLGADMVFHTDTDTADKPDSFEVKTIHLGYNVRPTKGLELIVDFGVALPQNDDDDTAFNAMIGLVGALPAAH